MTLVEFVILFPPFYNYISAFEGKTPQKSSQPVHNLIRSVWMLRRGKRREKGQNYMKVFCTLKNFYWRMQKIIVYGVRNVTSPGRRLRRPVKTTA